MYYTLEDVREELIPTGMGSCNRATKDYLYSTNK